MLSQKPMELGSQSLTPKCSTMRPGNPFIQKVKRQGHESQKRCRRKSLHSCECWLFLVVVNISLDEADTADQRTRRLSGRTTYCMLCFHRHRPRRSDTTSDNDHISCSCLSIMLSDCSFLIRMLYKDTNVFRHLLSLHKTTICDPVDMTYSYQLILVILWTANLLLVFCSNRLTLISIPVL